MRCLLCQPIKKILGYSGVIKKDKTAKDEPVQTSSKSEDQ